MKSWIDRIDHLLPWTRLTPLTDWVIEQGITLQQIAAPTFAEQERAAYVASQFTQLGLESVEIDSVFNVYGLLPGENRSAPGVMVAAHTDTIFPAEADLTVRRNKDTISGPGLGDNSMGVAGMLGLIAALQRENLTPGCDLWFAATSREEGLGDLGGMKAAFAKLRTKIGAVINLEGLAYGHIYHSGIAVRRLHIVAKTGGGHSWLHFGRPSATHGIVELGALITTIKPPTTPRTTYNIGMLEGGQAINAIATEAGLWLDLRSEDPAALQFIEQQVRKHIASLESTDLHFEVEIVGDRPAGRIAPSHSLVQGALYTLERLGVRGMLETGSTDGNVPLSEGCPTVTIGITRGGNAHRMDEFIEVAYITDGLRQLITLTLATAAFHAETLRSVT